jgi:transposase
VKNVYRDQVFEWHKRFKEERESLQDEEQKGRPSTSRREELMEVVQKCLAEDHTLSIRMLEEGD